MLDSMLANLITIASFLAGASGIAASLSACIVLHRQKNTSYKKAKENFETLKNRVEIALREAKEHECR